MSAKNVCITFGSCPSVSCSDLLRIRSIHALPICLDAGWTVVNHYVCSGSALMYRFSYVYVLYMDTCAVLLCL